MGLLYLGSKNHQHLRHPFLNLKFSSSVPLLPADLYLLQPTQASSLLTVFLSLLALIFIMVAYVSGCVRVSCFSALWEAIMVWVTLSCASHCTQRSALWNRGIQHMYVWPVEKTTCTHWQPLLKHDWWARQWEDCNSVQMLFQWNCTGRSSY